MDDVAFRRELEKYKVVRSRDYVDLRDITRRYTAGSTSSSLKPGNSLSASEKNSQCVSSAAVSVPISGDFWTRLDGFLKVHLPRDAQREKVVRAFDEVSRAKWPDTC